MNGHGFGLWHIHFLLGITSIVVCTFKKKWHHSSGNRLQQMPHFTDFRFYGNSMNTSICMKLEKWIFQDSKPLSYITIYIYIQHTRSQSAVTTEGWMRRDIFVHPWDSTTTGRTSMLHRPPTGETALPETRNLRHHSQQSRPLTLLTLPRLPRILLWFQWDLPWTKGYLFGESGHRSNRRTYARAVRVPIPSKIGVGQWR